MSGDVLEGNILVPFLISDGGRLSLQGDLASAMVTLLQSPGFSECGDGTDIEQTSVGHLSFLARIMIGAIPKPKAHDKLTEKMGAHASGTCDSSSACCQKCSKIHFGKVVYIVHTLVSQINSYSAPNVAKQSIDWGTPENSHEKFKLPSVPGRKGPKATSLIGRVHFFFCFCMDPSKSERSKPESTQVCLLRQH